MSPRSSPTVRQIAAKAGCSIATVSMALKNNLKISAKTREKIARIAVESGYTLDPVVSTLMSRLRIGGRRRTSEKLAYLTFWTKAYEWQVNINESDYFKGACERANFLGYEIEHFWAKDPGVSAARLSKILYTRGIRGVLLGPFPAHVGHLSLNWHDFSSAALSLTMLKPELHRATHNYYEGMMLALRTVKRMGYRRFGFANSALFDRRVRHGWLSGFLFYQFNLPAKQCVPPLLMEKWTTSDARKSDSKTDFETFSEWYDRYRPDVILSNTTHPLTYLRRLRLRVPQDVGYVSLHKLRETDEWAGIDRLSNRIGAAAVDLVVAQLQNNEFGLPANPKNVLLNGVWSDGPSVQNQVHAAE